eukprot:CAMPEP_0171139066 /NCGR_PEP_ID=MMETSP0766_2-20121228/136197_1 /TAXON_ID=439317 /ORGANISM="Gambierdiscus australes, Strain CAWD 149" /LENGTH=110 /DNA_ID=CAMNT_0011602711 /DNA_START=138 /DNA_END=466 /DNA_ORIENTATION=+
MPPLSAAVELSSEEWIDHGPQRWPRNHTARFWHLWVVSCCGLRRGSSCTSAVAETDAREAMRTNPNDTHEVPTDGTSGEGSPCWAACQGQWISVLAALAREYCRKPEWDT